MTDAGLVFIGILIGVAISAVLLHAVPSPVLQIAEPIICKLDMSEHPMGKFIK